MSDLQVLTSFEVTQPEGDGDKKLPITGEVAGVFRDALGVTAIIGDGMLEADKRLKEIALNGTWRSFNVTSKSASGFPLITSVVWPDGKPGIKTAVEDLPDWENSPLSWQVTYGDPVEKTFTQPAMTRGVDDGRVTVRPQIIISTP